MHLKLTDRHPACVIIGLCLAAAAGMPKPVVERINREINSILNVPEMRELLAKQGADPRTGTPEEFTTAMSSDLQKWAKVVATAGIKVQR